MGLLGRKPAPQGRRSSVGSKAGANQVFSYHASRSSADVPRARHEQPQRSGMFMTRLVRLPMVFSIVLIVGCLLYVSLLNSNPRVMLVASASGKSLQRSETTYQSFIANELARSFTNKSKLTINAKSITTALQNKYPEVSSAVITLPLIGHRPIVYISVSSPALILATTSGAYYISQDGRPLVRVADVTNPVTGLTTVSDATGISITVGEQALPTNTVAFITEVLEQLKASNIPINQASLPLEANELEVRVSGQPYKVRYNLLGDAKLQTGTFLAVKSRLQGSGEVPHEYIDVRVASRAYYK